MNTKERWIGIRNLLIVLLVLFFVLFIVDRLLPVVTGESKKTTYSEYDNTIGMRYEKTPPEKLITVAEARSGIQEFSAEAEKFVESDYPEIDDMVPAKNYDANTVEIVVFGDSFVYGDGSLNRNELFWRQTEQILREFGYNCRVTAIAMAGATAFEELHWYENYLKTHTPDLVVFGYVYNDALLDGSTYQDPQNIEYSEILPVLKPVHVLLPNIYSRLKTYIDAKTMYSEKFGNKWENTNTTVLKGNVRSDYQKYFVDKLDAITTETKIPAIVMTLPNEPNSIILKELYKPLDDIYSNTSIRFFNPFQEFNKFFFKKNQANLYVNSQNHHPGSAAHRFFAEYLVQILEKDFGAVLGNRQENSLLSSEININDWTPFKIDFKTIKHTSHYAEYSFRYPTERIHTFFCFTMEPYWLIYPLNKSYIKLSFENPVDLSSVTISGPDLETAEVYYSKVNEKLGYDDNTLTEISLVEQGTDLCGEINEAKITSFCIHVDENIVGTNRIHLRIQARG